MEDTQHTENNQSFLLNEPTKWCPSLLQSVRSKVTTCTELQHTDGLMGLFKWDIYSMAHMQEALTHEKTPRNRLVGGHSFQVVVLNSLIVADFQKYKIRAAWVSVSKLGKDEGNQKLLSAACFPAGHSKHVGLPVEVEVWCSLSGSLWLLLLL